jgi:hypothetical protein
MNYIISIWIIVLNFSAQVHGANSERPISLQIENLSHWRSSSKVSAIQQSLGALLKPRRNYPRSLESLKEIKQYNSLFQQPFVLLEAEANGFGGFFALIVFQNHPKVFRVWVYEVDKNVFELRMMTPLRARLNKTVMRELDDKRIIPFWVRSSF